MRIESTSDVGVELGRRRVAAASWRSGGVRSAAARRPASAQVSLFDPRFDEVRRASVAWDRRSGPEREVVDLVCLVPDVADLPRGDRHLGRTALLPDPDRRRRVHLQVPPRVPARPDRPLSASEVGADPARASSGSGPSRPSGGRGRREGGPADKLPRGRRRPADARAASRPAWSSRRPTARRSPGPSRWPRGGSSRCSGGRPPKHFADVLSLDEARALAVEPRSAGRRPRPALRPARRRLRLRHPRRRLSLSLPTTKDGSTPSTT